MANSQQMANAIRALAMDAVQQANSGHPGAPMGMADMAVALWGRHLKHNPANPQWFDRDRFVLSNGHASMLLYAVLHLSGYDLPVQELKNFRKLHSKTAGHPEVGVTPGVETTTGPLGQGITNAVGFALAEKLLAAEFNRDKHTIVNHHTYTFLGDGCLMEGISHEAVALAGAWKLNKLIALYDDNGISIDGKVAPWFVDNTAERFEAYQWNVIGPIDGHDVDAVDRAIGEARQSADRPTLIICRTHIGKGSPNRQDTAKAHGEPLGASEIALTREALGWPHGPFVIPDEIYAAWDAKPAGAQAEQRWDERFAAYAQAYPRLAADFKRRMAGELPKNFAQVAVDAAVEAHKKAETVASRKASQIALEAFTAALPELIGGSADLTGSNLTNTSFTTPLRFNDDGSVVLPEPKPDREAQLARGTNGVGKEDEPGNSAAAPLPEVDHKAAAPAISARFHINYGVREFGMAAVMNGIALHGGYIPYGGTFLTFSDYSRNAIRMAALMKLRVVHVFTHDSIGLGEDGPTHQSVEHVPSLRIIPNLDVWRPADGLETAVAWGESILRMDGPSALILSRQNLPNVTQLNQAELIAKGGYVLKDADHAQALIIATGSEVEIALQAQKQLAEQGIAVRVVSMPCTSAFDRQTAEYQNSVLPRNLPAVAIEAAQPDFWHKYVGRGAVVGMTTFGESAPAKELYQYFGITAEQTVEAVKQQLV